MGMPSINIIFCTVAAASIARSQKGVVALILRDTNTTAAGAHVMADITEIPTTLDSNNRAYIERAFVGYINPPRTVMAFVLDADDELTEALNYFEMHPADYLCGPADCTTQEASGIAGWVKSRRADKSVIKAVLPNHKGDSEGVVNVTTEDIKQGETVFTTAQYCSRIAGLLAGTPMTSSSTYAPLLEVLDFKRLSRAAMDTAIDAGEFILYHDGEKVKVARGVNSLITTTKDKGAAFQKIKVVEVLDMIRHDIFRTIEDSYIGKFSNSYDNKCLLISAIVGYLETLELAGILQAGGSQIGIDIAAQRAYLKGKGVDVEKMSEQDIKQADTDDTVLLAGKVKILDAIEEVTINMTM